jgi:SAM-dependent methyltransferase
VVGAQHWNTRYAAIGADAVSWHEETPTTSLELIRLFGSPAEMSVLDVGGGASNLSSRLLSDGYADVGVLDVSGVALDEARGRVGGAVPISWIEADLLAWEPERTWDVWHDRAVLHFLVDEADRAAYRSKLRAALSPGGGIVIGVFAEDGPEQCSDLAVRRYSIDDLVAFVADAEVIETRRQIHTTPAGIEQPFNWVAARLA